MDVSYLRVNALGHWAQVNGFSLVSVGYQMPVSRSSTETYVSDHDVGDARDEQMPSGIAGIGRACYSTLENVGVPVTNTEYVVGE
jgi:hypothetical protein